jgi:hypothetical protein
MDRCDHSPPPGVPPPFAEKDMLHGLTQLGRVADAVRAEIDLVGMRLTWLVIAESFICSAFAVAVASYDPSRILAEVLRYRLWTMPLVGMLLAGCVYVGILAAHRAGEQLMAQREQLMERLPAHLRIRFISSQSREYWWGNVPPRIIPPLIFVVWLGALICLLLFASPGRMAYDHEQQRANGRSLRCGGAYGLEQPCTVTTGRGRGHMVMDRRSGRRERRPHSTARAGVETGAMALTGMAQPGGSSGAMTLPTAVHVCQGEAGAGLAWARAA